MARSSGSFTYWSRDRIFGSMISILGGDIHDHMGDNCDNASVTSVTFETEATALKRPAEVNVVDNTQVRPAIPDERIGEKYDKNPFDFHNPYNFGSIQSIYSRLQIPAENNFSRQKWLKQGTQ